MKTYAVVDESGMVINVIVWDGVSDWHPPARCFAYGSDTACIGDFFDLDTQTFIKPKS